MKFGIKDINEVLRGIQYIKIMKNGITKTSNPYKIISSFKLFKTDKKGVFSFHIKSKLAGDECTIDSVKSIKVTEAELKKSFVVKPGGVNYDNPDAEIKLLFSNYEVQVISNENIFGKLREVTQIYKTGEGQDVYGGIELVAENLPTPLAEID